MWETYRGKKIILAIIQLQRILIILIIIKIHLAKLRIDLTLNLIILLRIALLPGKILLVVIQGILIIILIT